MATTYVQNLRLLNRDVRLYFIAPALAGLCRMGIYSVVFNLYLLRLGYDPEFIGLVNATGSVSYAVFSLPAGALGGRWGVRRMMIVGLGLAAVGLALPPLNEFIATEWREAWLLVSYPIGLCGMALFIVNSGVFLMYAAEPHVRSQVFSMQVGIWPLAAFAGSLIGGLLPEIFATALSVSLDDPAPYRYSLLVAGLLLIPSLPVVMATREVETEETTAYASTTQRAPYALIILLALVQLLLAGGGGAVRAFFNVYLDTRLHIATHQIGTLTAAGQLLAAPVALVTPTLIARWGKERTCLWGSFVTMLTILPLAFISHWAAAGIGLLGVMALSSVWRPAIMLYRMELVSQRWWALMNGASQMATGLSMSSMALGGGYIVTSLGYRSLFLTGAVVSLSGGLLFWIFFRVPRGELADYPAPRAAD